jgi:hypothetical protein
LWLLCGFPEADTEREFDASMGRSGLKRLGGEEDEL